MHTANLWFYFFNILWAIISSTIFIICWGYFGLRFASVAAGTWPAALCLLLLPLHIPLPVSSGINPIIKLKALVLFQHMYKSQTVLPLFSICTMQNLKN
jgi:hypothetical protein